MRRQFQNVCLLLQDFLSDEAALRQRLLKAAAINLVLAPFLLMFLVIYFFMKHAERFYHSPGVYVCVCVYVCMSFDRGCCRAQEAPGA